MVFIAAGRCCLTSSGISRFRAALLQTNSIASASFLSAQCSTNPVNKYVKRSHTCGELRATDCGKEVTLYGWLEYQRLDQFGVLRDGYGSVQLFIPDGELKTSQILTKLNLESVLKIDGVVRMRPKDQSNEEMETGEIEVTVKNLDILNMAKVNMPFLVREHKKAKESLRLKYRYLDLRFPQLQRNLRLRSKFIMKMRDFLINESGFVEVETPTLFKKTPGGAREFIVPTHVKNQYYALVQSPQQLKQLLMVGSIDRYFQVARCYRDEGARRDRQPEFTQLDIELSFLEQENIFQLIENLLEHSWPSDITPISIPFPRMTYEEAMDKYGSDKPDLSFQSEIHNLTPNFIDSVKDSDILQRKHHQDVEDLNIHCVTFPQMAGNFTKGTQKKLETITKESFQDVILLPLLISSEDAWQNKLLKILPSISVDDFKKVTNISNGDLLFVAIGKKYRNLSLLGQTRLEYADFLDKKNISFGRDKNSFNFCWITDFPLFTQNDQTGQIESSHHPFTQPHPDDLPFLMSNPLKVRGQHYDLVLNGAEIGGGSIRIHSHKLQRQILDQILGIPTSSLEHLLEALHSGCPPHGGIALGLDRLISIICQESSIRDVIAFPKSFESRDLMVQAPCDIPDEDKKYYHQSITSSEEATLTQEVDDIAESHR